jgi:hypothetical protein
MAVANMLDGRVDFGSVTIGSANPAEDQDLFDSLIAKAVRAHVELNQVPMHWI